jgi:hypothetical protein
MNKHGATWMALGTLLMVAACGQARSGTIRLSSDQLTGVELNTDLVHLYDQINGTAVERSAAEYVSYRTLQDSLTSCMSSAGHAYTPPPFIDHWQHHVSDGGADSTNFLAPLHDAVVSRTAQADAAANLEQQESDNAQPNPRSEAATDPKTYGAALELCESDVQGSDDAASHPKDYYALIESFHLMLNNVDSKLASFRDDYQSCMAEAGYDVQSYPDLLTRIGSRVPPVGEASLNPADSSWDKLKTYEASALDADAKCRSSAYAAGQDLLAPAIAAFNSDHASELQQTDAAWNQLVAKANDYANSPGFGR